MAGRLETAHCTSHQQCAARRSRPATRPLLPPIMLHRAALALALAALACAALAQPPDDAVAAADAAAASGDAFAISAALPSVTVTILKPGGAAVHQLTIPVAQETEVRVWRRGAARPRAPHGGPGVGSGPVPRPGAVCQTATHVGPLPLPIGTVRSRTEPGVGVLGRARDVACRSHGVSRAGPCVARHRAGAALAVPGRPWCQYGDHCVRCGAQDVRTRGCARVAPRAGRGQAAGLSPGHPARAAYGGQPPQGRRDRLRGR